jgi:hypothetical protein
MAFNGNEGEMVDATTAQKWIENYEKAQKPGAVKAHFFGFRRLNELMGQGEAIGVRIYYAKDEAGVDKLVLVAVTPGEANIAKVDGSKAIGLVLDGGYPCPPYCHNG